MFSIRKPAEAIVIEILADEMYMHEHPLLQETNERIKQRIARTTTLGHRLLEWLMLHDKESFRQMLDDMEKRNVVKHTDRVIHEYSEWDEPRKFIQTRIYELQGDTHEQCVPYMRLHAI